MLKLILLLLIPSTAAAGDSFEDKFELILWIGGAIAVLLSIIAHMPLSGPGSSIEKKSPAEDEKKCAELLENLSRGIVPVEDPALRSSLPFAISRKESCICFWNKVEVVESQLRARSKTGASGFSIRITDNIVYHAGRADGSSSSEIKNVSIGLCFVLATTHNIYIRTPNKSLIKIPTHSVVGAAAESNGVNIDFQDRLPVFIRVPGKQAPLLAAAVKFRNEWIEDPL